MDEYGSCRVTKEDAKEVREALKLRNSVVFPLSGDQMGCIIVHIDTQFYKIGTMPFGGNPVGRYYVGIYGRGCNHFAPQRTEPSYFSEKLNISMEEAKWLADFWEMMFEV